MAITPKSVFLSLSEQYRVALLDRQGIKSNPAIEVGDFSSLARGDRRNLELDLNLVATLGTEYANEVLHEQLNDAGWSRDQISRTQNQRDRACALLCEHPDHFTTALAIWNGNRLRGKLHREDGFKLPEIGDFVFEPHSDDEHEYLVELIQSVIEDSYPNYVVSKVRVFSRSSLGLPTESQNVIQCDISFGEDPETIEIVDGGVEQVLRISRLSRISIVVDVSARTLFVGTTLGKRKLHQGLAQVLVQNLFGVGAPPTKLAPVRVHPERCNRRIEFSFKHNDGIKRPRVTEIRYRLFGSSSNLVFSARCDDKNGEIFEHEDVRKLERRMRIWRAYIEFVFVHPERGTEIRRTIALTEPSTISFGRAFPDERMTIERVLASSGLIDPNFDWAGLAKLRDIARLLAPQHFSEIRASWVSTTIDALFAAGVLKQGPPHERAWCSLCGESHRILTKQTTDNIEDWIACPEELRLVKPEDLDTLQLSSDGLVSWLSKSLAQDGEQPEVFPAGSNIWYVGKVPLKKASKQYEIILALDVDNPRTSSDLNSFLGERHLKSGGVILTLANSPIHQVFPRDWRVVPFHAVCDVKNGALKFYSSKLASARLGKAPPKKQKGQEDWEEVFALFLQLFPGDTVHQVYPVANAMIGSHPDICDVSVRSLVEKLAARFPDRFESTSSQ